MDHIPNPADHSDHIVGSFTGTRRLLKLNKYKKVHDKAMRM